VVCICLAAVALVGCGGKKTARSGNNGGVESDKALFDRATNDIDHHRYEVARLTLQTLINTYPDSEYLAKAKLAVADSYFQEGGISGLTQSIAEYQDFITFFPFLDEAAYAQMQIGLAHYRRIEKPDRDRSEALEAEAAFQTFLQTYPHTELYPAAEQRLREVQEVLAEGDFRIASFYFLRKSDRAAATRLMNLVNRYPLYSQADRANWMLASIYDRNKSPDLATTYYTRIVKQYPLSPLVAEAKQKLEKGGKPVPDADADAVARMQQEQRTPRQKHGILSAPAGALKTGPDVSMAARFGTPTLTPDTDQITNGLTAGGKSTVVASPAGGGTGAGSSAYVETVTTGGNGGAATGGSAGSSDSSAASSTVAPSSSAGGATTGSNSAPSGATNDPSSGSTSQSGGNSSSSNNKKKKDSKKKSPQS